MAEPGTGPEAVLGLVGGQGDQVVLPNHRPLPILTHPGWLADTARRSTAMQ